MNSVAAFPRLSPQNHRVSSPATKDCNCVAWAAGDLTRWWQPGVFWPVQASPGEFGIDVLVGAFLALGYERCADGGLEPGFEKVALYADGQFYTHAARQVPTGKRTSKLGKSEDIEHDTADDVSGGVYGSLFGFMKRTR